MFEEKIKLNPVEIDNVVEKEICGQKFKFNKYLETQYYGFIIDECIHKFLEIGKDTEFANSIRVIMQTMNICLCYLTTNIDISDIAYDDLNIMGVFKIIEENLINYQEIKDSVLVSFGILFSYMSYDTLRELPTSKQMTENLQEITEVFKSNPEKAKEYANIVMANHPELQGFGKIFEKILNNLNKKE